MRKYVFGCAVAGVLAVGLIGGPASAAPPVVSGCVGESISTNARALQPYGRNFVSQVTPRNDFGSLGNALQALKAGAIPDELYWNTCNG